VPLPRDQPLTTIGPVEQLGGAADNPATDCRMVDRDGSLGHHLFQIPEAGIVGQLLTQREQDHESIKMAASEHHTPPESAAGVGRTEPPKGAQQIPRPRAVVHPH
jgi:hypothetical protein